MYSVKESLNTAALKAAKNILNVSLKELYGYIEQSKIQLEKALDLPDGEEKNSAVAQHQNELLEMNANMEAIKVCYS